MEIRRVRPAEIDAVHRLLSANGWGARLDRLVSFDALIDASQLAEVALVDGRVVAFLRGITDGLSNGYLSMVVVDPAHRGRGVGRALVEHAVGGDRNVTWVLRAGRDGASGFFAKVGFEPSTIAMERSRERPSTE